MPSLLSCGEQDLNPSTPRVLRGFQGRSGNKPADGNPAKSGVGAHEGCSGARVCDDDGRDGGHGVHLLLVLAALLAVTLSGCIGAPEPPAAHSAVLASERPSTTPEERAASGACWAAFDHVAEAWEEVVGPLPVECWAVPAGYTIELLTSEELGASPQGEVTYGRVFPDVGAIYVLESMSDGARTWVTAHEWVHALAACALGDMDAGHEDERLWVDGPTVLGIAGADGLPDGHCLEVTHGS